MATAPEMVPGTAAQESTATEAASVAAREAGMLESMVMDVVRSVYTPGINRGVVQFMAVLMMLMLVNTVVLLIFFGPNIHIFALLFLTVILAGLMAWYEGCGRR